MILNYFFLPLNVKFVKEKIKLETTVEDHVQSYMVSRPNASHQYNFCNVPPVIILFRAMACIVAYSATTALPTGPS